MLFLDTDIEETVGELAGECLHSAAARHRRGDADHTAVLTGKFAEDLSEDVLEAVRLPFGDNPFAGLRVELAGGMPYARVALGRSVTVAFGRDTMEDQRTVDGLELTETADHLFYVVAVDRAEVAKAERLEHIAAHRLDYPRFEGAEPGLQEAPESAVAELVPDFVLELVVPAA